MIGDDTRKATIEAAMAFVASYPAPGVPASGTWKLNSSAGETPAMTDGSSYKKVWSGKVLDAEMAKKMATRGGKVPTWSLGPNKSVVWRPHSWEMMSASGPESELAAAENAKCSI